MPIYPRPVWFRAPPPYSARLRPRPGLRFLLEPKKPAIETIRQNPALPGLLWPMWRTRHKHMRQRASAHWSSTQHTALRDSTKAKAKHKWSALRQYLWWGILGSMWAAQAYASTYQSSHQSSERALRNALELATCSCASGCAQWPTYNHTVFVL